MSLLKNIANVNMAYEDNSIFTLKLEIILKLLYCNRTTGKMIETFVFDIHLYLQFQAVGRNSFQNIRKPDITKVELLKDVQNKKELIIRLVAHDIDQEISESNLEEELTSDEDEVVLREIVQEEHVGGKFEYQVKEATKLVENKIVSPKPTQSASSLKKFFSLSTCCQPTSNPNVENTEATSNHVIEPKKGQVKRTVAELDMATCSRTLTKTDPSLEEKPQRKVSENYDCQ